MTKFGIMSDKDLYNKITFCLDKALHSCYRSCNTSYIEQLLVMSVNVDDEYMMLQCKCVCLAEDYIIATSVSTLI